MSNAIFEVKRNGTQLWADWPEPISRHYYRYEFAKEMEAYNSRPHYNISGSHNWKDGDKKTEGIDFKLADAYACFKEWKIVAIPINQTTMNKENEKQHIASAYKDVEQQDIPMEKEIRAAILGTLVIENKQSIDLAVKKILKIVSQSPKEEKE